MRSAILASALAVLLCGCGRSPGDDNTREILVGEFVSLTGKEASYGQSSHKGVMLAVEGVNAAGGLLGRQLKLVYEDNRSLQGESATIVKKLIARDRVVALLGELTSGRTLEAAPIAQAAKVPLITPAATDPKVTQVGDYIFRTAFTDPFQGRLLANFAEHSLKVRRVAILADAASPYSLGLASYFAEAWRARGRQVIADAKYSSGEKDFRAQLTRIRSAAPEAIFLPGYYTEVGLIVAQARELGIDLPLFGGEGWESPQLIEIAGAAALEGTFFDSSFSAESTETEARQFVEAYKTRYGEVPDALAAAGFEAVIVLVDAIRRAGTTEPDALRAALAATRNVPGPRGPTSLDDQRDASKRAVILTVKGGRFHYVESISP
jgi:branched-chain amino acid transport system substrate-binding protein